MNPFPVLLLAFLIGVIAGLRSMTAPAVVAWGARLHWLKLQSSLLSSMPADRIVHQGPTQRCARVGTATGAGQEKLVRQATLSHENPRSAARRHRFNAASLGSSAFIYVCTSSFVDSAF